MIPTSIPLSLHPEHKFSVNTCPGLLLQQPKSLRLSMAFVRYASARRNQLDSVWDIESVEARWRETRESPVAPPNFSHLVSLMQEE